mmetsp:Transcript_42806/g.97358  ORF Transcript_42806/g.97358 Transcript_42806/m.97358 type:complete len:272 (+) Transcript_42806:166-981(+)
MAPPRGAAFASDSFKLIRRKSSVSDLSPELARRALMDAFAEADKDASGFIDRAELVGVIQKMGVHMQNPTDDIDALFEALDIDGDGSIDVVEFCTKFEPAIKRDHGVMGKMDVDVVMKETFDKMLVDARDQRTAVNRSFMQAREDCQEWFCKKFLGSKWRMKTFDAFYTNGGKGSASRLAHLRKSLDEAIKGKNEWITTSLESDQDFKREVLDKDGIGTFADKWLARLEAEMGTITAKRLASCETNRTMSMVSNGTRTSSHEDANASAPLE